jgi:hypothetical protein
MFRPNGPTSGAEEWKINTHFRIEIDASVPYIYKYYMQLSGAELFGSIIEGQI